MTKNEDILLPFHQSRQSRHAYMERTQAILSAVENCGSGDAPIVLTLPNIPDIEDDDEERRRRPNIPTRPTSTYILRSPSNKEMETLFDPQQCNCCIANGSGVGGGKDGYKLKLMYRVAGNGEGKGMTTWDLSPALKRQIKNCCFGGKFLVLGVLVDGPDSIDESASSSLSKVPGASNNGLLSDSVLEPGSAIHNNTEINCSHVMSCASIIGCGSVTCSKEVAEQSFKKCKFDMKNGSMDIEVGPEAGGGRGANVKVESTLVDVCHALNMDSGGKTIAPMVSSPDSSNSSASASAPHVNILCPHSSLSQTPLATHIFLHPHSHIAHATSVHSTLLLPHSRIQNSSTVSHALLQWSSTLTSHSDAHFVFLMECAEVGPHSFTANAIYGPDSHVSGGEVHCTVFGPNANAHHQSLLIGILWALGRGNVGYGSNVGSNHTGRIPDQETSVGEGTFWGLGSVIKFPIDLTSAPYSIIAAGVQLPPQRITLPFSLITDGPGGMNQLTPGWLLHYSPYTIARSEVKFANRRTAKRHNFYTGWKIVRPCVMDMCLNARDVLVHAGKQQQQQGGQSSGEGTSPKKKSVVFRTDKAIPGLGANQLTEKGRQIGVRAYTDVIQRYALRGLLDRLVAFSKNGPVSLGEVLRHVGLDGVNSAGITMVDVVPPKPIVDWPILPWNEASHTDPEALWKHQHSILMNELPSILIESKANNADSIFSPLLQKCIALEDDHAKRVYKSKSRDDVRGANTVPGYKDVHVSAEEDAVVLAAKDEAQKIRADVKLVMDALGSSGSGGTDSARSKL